MIVDMGCFVNLTQIIVTRDYFAIYRKMILTRSFIIDIIQLVAYERQYLRGVAQPGSARALGAWGRGFKSLHPDQFRGEGKYVAPWSSG